VDWRREWGRVMRERVVRRVVEEGAKRRM